MNNYWEIYNKYETITSKRTLTVRMIKNGKSTQIEYVNRSDIR